MKKSWKNLDNRTRLREYTKTETIMEKTLYGAIKKEKLKYRYYICDNCLKEVIITDFERIKANGSITYFRKPNGFRVPIALHNSCFKEAIESINNYYLS